MIERTQNNRCVVIKVSLTECPWLRDTNLQLPGYVEHNFNNALTNVRAARLAPGIIIRCFESDSGNYVVNLHYSVEVTEADRVKAITALDQWSKELYNPRSCVVDPNTGNAPIKTDNWFW